MKNFKKIAATIAALSLAACMVAPVATMTSFADTTETIASTASNNTITINDNVSGHTYKAYQIFSGDLEKTIKDNADIEYGALSNVTWGEGVDSVKAKPDGEEGKTLIQAIQAIKVSNTSPFQDADTPAKVAKVLGDATPKEDPEVAKAFAQAIAPYLLDTGAKNVEEQTGDSITYKATGLKTGYYLVQQTGLTAGSDEAYTRFILEVAGDATASPKKSSPSVDKQVSDNDTDDNSSSNSNKNKSTTLDSGKGWFETADHAIGEQFQFKLTAEMTEDKELDEYKRYTLKFSDVMATGVTYEGIASVQIIYKDGTTAASGVKPKGASDNLDGYVTSFTGLTEETTDKGDYKGDGTTAWTLTIPDLKKYLVTGKNLSDVKSVEVVYNAHLNDDAIVVDSDVDSTAGSYGVTSDMKVNINKVDLEYSNNPNKTDWGAEGTPDSDTGKTPEDTVGVFTYKVKSTKVDGASKQGDSYNKTLPGAVFSLYDTDPDVVDFSGSPISLVAIKDTGDNVIGYRKAKADETTGTVTQITTPATGEFVFYGLDAGTYYIDEVTAPSGYNKLEKAIKVDIVAKHAEVDDGSVTLDLSASKYDSETAIGAGKAIEGNIENNKGASLPSTGGIGTTIFYVVGGVLVVGAGVTLITKKRMTKD